MAVPDTDLDDEGLVIPPVDDASVEQMLFMTFLVNHRALYDFFDEAGYKVFITWSESGYSGEVGGDKIEEVYKTRTEAEQALFRKAIDKIENQ